MSGYSTAKKNYDKNLDLTRLKPYGDTLNDGRVQISFTLPVKNCEKSTEAAKALAAKMGLKEIVIASVKPLDDDFTFYVLYGSVEAGIDYTAIDAPSRITSYNVCYTKLLRGKFADDVATYIVKEMAKRKNARRRSK